MFSKLSILYDYATLNTEIGIEIDIDSNLILSLMHADLIHHFDQTGQTAVGFQIPNLTILRLVKIRGIVKKHFRCAKKSAYTDSFPF